MSADLLQDNPIDTVIEAITTPETVVSVNDTTIGALVGAAQNLEGDALVNAQISSELAVQQATHEDLAIESFSNADDALTENAYFANEGKAERHENIATAANIGSHTTAMAAEDASATAAELNNSATIQIAVAEIESRTHFAAIEVADRTQAGVKEEMRIMNAVAEDPNSAQNLEAQAKMVSALENDAPKFKG